MAFADMARAVEFYFPIIADGFIPNSTDAFYVTELVINNPNNTRVSAFVSFFANDGTPLDVNLRIAQGSGASSTTDSGSFFTATIEASGTFRAYTTAAGALKTGWVIVDADDFVNTIAIFSLNSRNSGLISEATVFDAASATRQRLFGDTYPKSTFITQFTNQTGSDTGIAIANTETRSAAITIRLLDSTGRESRSTRVTLAALAATAKFLKELFSGLSSFQGTVELQSDVPVAVLGLRYTGAVFTTVPVSVLQ